MIDSVYELSITRANDDAKNLYHVWEGRNKYYPIQDQFFSTDSVIFTGTFAACIKFLKQEGIQRLTPKLEEEK